MITTNNTSDIALKFFTKCYKNLSFCMKWALATTIILVLKNDPNDGI